MSTGFLTQSSSGRIGTTDDLARAIWNNGASGMLMSGDPGSGKSVFARQIFRSIVRNGDSAVLVLDPAGDLAEGCRNDCLHMGGSVVDRMHYIEYANTQTLVPMNPLHVRRTDDMDDFTHAARRSCRVSHTSHILLSAWGQKTWEGTPLLYKWVTLFLNSLAEMGLPMAEVMHFLHPGTELYETLAECVPDFFDRLDLQQLADMKPKEANEEIRSVGLRFRGFFGNPITETTLGVADPELCLNVAPMIDRQQIVIVNLAGRGMLRQEDVQIFANLLLAEWFHEVLGRRPEERRQSVIICDELPVFTPSFPLIEECIRLMRKTLTRFFGLCQGTQSFPDGTESPLLQTLVGGTGIKAVFRHTNPIDAKFFGDILATPNLDPHIVKFEHYEREQYQDGFEVRTLVNQSFNAAYSDTLGGAAAVGFDQSTNWNWNLNEDETNSNTKTSGTAVSDGLVKGEANSTHDGVIQDQALLGEAYRTSAGKAQATTNQNSHANTVNSSTAHANAIKKGSSVGGGGSQSETRNSTTNWQHTENSGWSLAYVRQLVPILRWRDVLRMKEFFTFEELKQLVATGVAREATGECFFYVAGVGVAQVQIPFARDPYEGTPQTLARHLERYFEALHHLPHYHRQVDILAYRRQLIPNVIADLRKLTAARPRLTDESQILNRFDDDDSNPHLTI